MLGMLGQFAGLGYQGLALVLFYLIAVLVALMAHEMAHGIVALWCGDPSAKYAGRLWPNPLRHLDPLGTVCFLLFGFGWAVPVPVNPRNFRHPRADMVWVALAGIVTNLLLAFVASFFFVLLYGTVWAYLFMYLMLVNIVFAVFNLLPLAPLDGFNFLAALFPHSGYVRFLRQNHLVGMLVLVLVLHFTNLLGLMENWLITLFLDFWGLIL